jgi:hypothetical protein
MINRNVMSLGLVGKNPPINWPADDILRSLLLEFSFLLQPGYQ